MTGSEIKKSLIPIPQGSKAPLPHGEATEAVRQGEVVTQNFGGG